ncbi:MAG TPA: polysaccharide biosynthesis protein [Candidatus Blautia stercoravium]|nr:polysaccharide biosynthesis protein [Candidatus Blautia stercoravium]
MWKKGTILSSRTFLLILLDILTIQVSSFLGLFVRYEFRFNSIPVYEMEQVLYYLLPNTIMTLVVFAIAKLYRSVWHHASASELVNIILGCGAAFFIQVTAAAVLKPVIPRSFYFIYFFAMVIGVSCTRFSYLIIGFLKESLKEISKSGKKRINVMLIGAGAAGNSILKETQESRYLNLKVKCIIDDNPAKKGKYLRGVEIVGTRDNILDKVGEYNIEEIIVAIPSLGNAKMKEILDICKESGCKIRIVPGIYQFINGDVSVSKLREVRIEDLLGREPIEVQLDEIMGYVQNKTVMVTGGGGSIGSELCRQIAAHNPKALIIVDIYENNAYEIQQELVRKYPDLKLIVLIASVRNTHRMNNIFDKYRPNIVYHAAAHKHVPLMEDSPNEAIKNNVFGTYKTAEAADRYGVEKFVLISTDKAVNPTNIMGASKRMCEMVVQMFARHSKTNFVAVRFGNVLGSNGSVIPLFQKQISEGGPVTVTHPDIIRYFMTIPEAVSLVLQAGAYAKGGEIFVLDMGKPVKILDLATNLIKLSGYKVGDDIQIEFTGLRPGEKLYEELLMSEEGLQDTANKMIHIGKPIEFDEEEFRQQLAELGELSRNDSPHIKEAVQKVVPTYVITTNGAKTQE